MIKLIIYKATNIINGKVYIGKTKRLLEERIREHKRDMQELKYYFYNALNKYGFSNFTWETIDTALTPEELNEKERYWINHYKSHDDKFGYNSTLGGEATWFDNHQYTNEQRDNLSLVNGGRYFLIYDTKGNFIGRYLNARRYSQENKITPSHFDKCLKGDRVSVKGVIPIYEDEFSEEILKERLSRVQIKNKPFFMYDKDGCLIGEFNNQTEVAKIFNLNVKCICFCLANNGKNKSTKGYTFKWKE